MIYAGADRTRERLMATEFPGERTRLESPFPNRLNMDEQRFASARLAREIANEQRLSGRSVVSTLRADLVDHLLERQAQLDAEADRLRGIPNQPIDWSRAEHGFSDVDNVPHR